MYHTVTLSEEQRQLVLLALSRLALERPGWDYALGEVVDLLSGRAVYEQFKRGGSMKRAIIFGGLDDVPVDQLDRQVDHDKLCKVIDVDSEETAQYQVVECLKGLGLSPGQYYRVPGTAAWVHASVGLAERADLVTRYAVTRRVPDDAATATGMYDHDDEN
jgi:hypothetical protein